MVDFFLRLGFFAFVPAPVALVTVFLLLLVPLGFFVVVVVAGAVDATGAVDDECAVNAAIALGAEVSMGAVVEVPALLPAAGIGAGAGAIIQTQWTEYGQEFLASVRLAINPHNANNNIKRRYCRLKLLQSCAL